MQFQPEISVIQVLDQGSFGLSTLFVNSVLQTRLSHNLNFYMIWIAET